MPNLLHINVIGKGSPLVLLHGWGWHSGIWSPLVPYLADKFQLFIPDLPGFGKSLDLTGDYAFSEIVNALFKKVPDQAAWLGWSLGGMVAWWASVHHPEKIARLITVASTPKFISDINWPGVSLTLLNQFANQLANHHQKTLTDFLRLQLGSKNSSLFAELQSQLLPIQSSALMGGLRLLSKTDLRADLSKIKIPSLHIFGEMDRLVPAGVIDNLRTLLFDGRCEMIKRAGHMPFLSHREEFLQLLNAWLITAKTVFHQQ